MPQMSAIWSRWNRRALIVAVVVAIALNVVAGQVVDGSLPDGVPGGLYLGNGRVFCYVKPLKVAMVLESSDVGITLHLCRGKGWEPEISQVFSRFLKPGGYVLDIGANVGYYTIMFSQAVYPSGGQVRAVEANPRTYEFVKQNAEILGYKGRSTTSVINRAIYDVDDKIVHISMSRERVLNNRVRESGSSMHDNPDKRTIGVRTVMVDTLVADWKQLDFVKIDVEGVEDKAYAGMTETIRRFGSTIVIIIECNTARMGAENARVFYNAMQHDFPQLRMIEGVQILPTTVEALLQISNKDVLVVLSNRDIPVQ